MKTVRDITRAIKRAERQIAELKAELRLMKRRAQARQRRAAGSGNRRGK